MALSLAVFNRSARVGQDVERANNYMVKIIHRFFRGRWERFYFKNHWHLVLDLSLVMIILILIAVAASLYSYRPNISWWSGFSGPEVDLNNPPLQLDFALESEVIKTKDAARLHLTLKNNSAAALSAIKLGLETTDHDFVVNRLEIDGDGKDAWKIDGQKMILSSLAPGASGEVDLKVYFTNRNLVSRTINWQMTGEYIFGGKLLKKNTVLTALLTAADLTVNSVAYYTSPQGDQLGVGPLPPIVGIPTNYWLFWEAIGSADFQDVVLSARLPQGVELTENRSLLAGEFSYNEATRQVIWKIKELKGDADNYRLGFEVRLAPTEKQVGQILPFLTAARYRAQDALTGEEASGAFKEPTSELTEDNFNRGQGKVVGE